MVSDLRRVGLVQGRELVVQGDGEVLEAGQLVALHLGLLLREDLRVERLLVFEQVPQDARQMESSAVVELGSIRDSTRDHRPQPLRRERNPIEQKKPADLFGSAGFVMGGAKA